MIDHAIPAMPFGKYADQPLDQIPEPYLLWLVTGATGGLDDDLVSAIWRVLHESAVRNVTAILRSRRTIDRELLKCARALKRRAVRWGDTGQACAELNREIIRLRQKR
jgi:hypothetical protein